MTRWLFKAEVTNHSQDSYSKTKNQAAKCSLKTKIRPLTIFKNREETNANKRRDLFCFSITTILLQPSLELSNPPFRIPGK